MRGAAATAVAFCLIAAAGPAAAQSPAPPQPSAQAPAQPQPPERTTAPRQSGLNLQLDEADLRSLSRSTLEPRDRSGEPVTAPGGLPSLGGDARPLERAPATKSTIPKDFQNQY